VEEPDFVMIDECGNGLDPVCGGHNVIFQLLQIRYELYSLPLETSEFLENHQRLIEVTWKNLTL